MSDALLDKLRRKARQHSMAIRKDKESGGYVVINSAGNTRYLVNCLVYGPADLESIGVWLDRSEN